MNPEFRQTLNTISRNFESANETAQENIYTFTQLYIDPCLSGLKSCIRDCTAPCFPSRDNQLRRKRGRSRGRAELNFDFYDDWDDDEDAGNSLAGWGNDELDSLLAGNKSARSGQPGKQRTMSYGSRGRRSQTTVPGEAEQDPTIIPSSSYLGFMERLPWKIGGKGLRYKPSAADLQENPSGLRIRDVENEPLIEASEESSDEERRVRHGRQRSGTTASRSTTNSLSSRGDLIPSDEEDDAIPLDEEFAVMLSRRTTNTGEDHSSGKSGRRPAASRASTRTVSSKSTKSGTKSRRSSSKKSAEPLSPSVAEDVEPPSMIDLAREEDKVRRDEELEVEQKRLAAETGASSHSLTSADSQLEAEIKPDIEPSSPDRPVTVITALDEVDVQRPDNASSAQTSPNNQNRKPNTSPDPP